MGETRPRPWPTLFVAAFALFMVMLDMTVVTVALPSIQHKLNAQPSDLEWVVNAFALPLAALMLLGSKLGDRFGRRAFFFVGVAVFTLGSALCGIAGDTATLIAGRCTQGIGGALMGPLSLSLIVAAFPRRQVPTAIGIWAGVSAFGLAIGPLVGGYLVDWVGWEGVFWINVPVGLAGLALTFVLVSESRDTSTRALDLAGTVLVTAGLLAVVWALIETTSHDWTDPEIVAGLGAGAVLLALFVARELLTREPMLPMALFRARDFAAANLVVFGLGFALAGTIYFLTLFLQNVQGYTAVEAGVRTLPATLMIVLIAPLAGRLNARIGPRAIVTVGALIGSIGLAGLAQLQPSSEYISIWPFLVCFGAGMALCMPSTAAVAMAAGGSTKAGVTSGVLNTSRQVGAAFGLAILGSIESTLARNDWTDFIATLPPSMHDRGVALASLVVGGQGSAVGRIVTAAVGPAAGTVARDQALSAFAGGATAAFAVAAVFMAAAAVAGLLGLTSARTADSPAPSVVL